MTEGTPLRHTWEIPQQERDDWMAAQPRPIEPKAVPITEESVAIKTLLDSATVRAWINPPEDFRL